MSKASGRIRATGKYKYVTCGLEQYKINKYKLIKLLSDLVRNLVCITIMHASLIRRQLGGLIPPKIATPKLVVSLTSSMQAQLTPILHVRPASPAQDLGLSSIFTLNFQKDKLPSVSAVSKADISVGVTRQGSQLLL